MPNPAWRTPLPLGQWRRGGRRGTLEVGPRPTQARPQRSGGADGNYEAGSVVLIRVTEPPFDQIHAADRDRHFAFGDAPLDLGYFIVIEREFKRHLRNGPLESDGCGRTFTFLLRCGFLF